MSEDAFVDALSAEPVCGEDGVFADFVLDGSGVEAVRDEGEDVSEADKKNS